jgi:hypothetical protein
MHCRFYSPIRMMFEMTSNLTAFCIILDVYHSHKLSLRICQGHNNLKLSYPFIHSSYKTISLLSTPAAVNDECHVGYNCKWRFNDL